MLLYIELSNGEVMLYEGTETETEKDAVDVIVDGLGDEVKTIYNNCCNWGPFGVIWERQ